MNPGNVNFNREQTKLKEKGRYLAIEIASILSFQYELNKNLSRNAVAI